MRLLFLMVLLLTRHFQVAPDYVSVIVIKIHLAKVLTATLLDYTS